MRISASYSREHFERVVPIVSNSVSVLNVDFSTVMLKRVNSSFCRSSTVMPHDATSTVILVVEPDTVVLDFLGEQIVQLQHAKHAGRIDLLAQFVGQHQCPLQQLVAFEHRSACD